MKDYVSRLIRVMPPEAMGSKYLFQVSLLKHVAKQLRDLYAEVQGAAQVVKTKDIPPGGDDAMSVAEVFMGNNSQLSLTSIHT